MGGGAPRSRCRMYLQVINPNKLQKCVFLIAYPNALAKCRQLHTVVINDQAGVTRIPEARNTSLTSDPNDKNYQIWDSLQRSVELLEIANCENTANLNPLRFKHWIPKFFVALFGILLSVVGNNDDHIQTTAAASLINISHLEIVHL